MESSENKNYYDMPKDKLEGSIGTSFKRGLAKLEAKRRLEQYGENAFPEKKPKPVILIFFSQFKSAFEIVMLVATGIAYALGETIDALIIFAAILVDVLTGAVQEAKAQKTVLQLRELVSLKAKVFRDNEEQIIDARELVPGDIIFIEEGDKAPADARLIEGLNIETNEAPLTGESISIQKSTDDITEEREVHDRKNMIFSGTIITRGHGKAVVTATGKHTEVGKIANLLKEVKDQPSPLQKRLSRFTLRIGIAAAIAVVAIFFGGLAVGNEFVEMFKTAISVAVAAIPEGLLVVITITLAIGMKRISTRQAVVRHPAAAETLGSTTVICTDKTGTLTEGIMKVSKLMHLDQNLKASEEIEHTDFEDALKVCLLCNNATVGYEKENQTVIGEPTEAALLDYALEHGLNKSEVEKKEPRVDEIPFDFKEKFMVTLHEKPGSKSRTAYAKGAPEVILERCTHISLDGEVVKLTASLRKKILKLNSELAKEGFRNLGLAKRTIPPQDFKNKEAWSQNLIFIGVISITDPIRLYVEESIRELKKAGIRVVMITGDHIETAKNIAKKLGLPTGEKNVIEGSELKKLSMKQLQKRVRDLTVYARVSPQDKLNIVHAWKEEGEIVAMTGDGVNDSPALKAADIGVAVGGGTELAKETSDMILLDNNLTTIEAAVEEGRVIFDNIKKVFTFMLGTNFGELLVIFGGIMTGLPLPLLAAQIIWVNLVSDGTPDVALATEPKERDVMDLPPRKPQEAIVQKADFLRIGYVGFVTAAITLGFFAATYHQGDPLEHARTMAFTLLSLITLASVLSYRSVRTPLWRMDFFSNRFLLAAVGSSLALQIIAIYVPFFQNILSTVPLDVYDWIVLIAASTLAFFLIELRKFFPHN